ncbi:MAG: DUF5716 family protein [Pigeon pea little leaf phytoplasma]|uniref:DUF5716 family protein n=1 Tax=Candidatus Phytoplasma fabacearum TaxID=2982628 RepID=A0ABU8ZSC8_9MOLU|nr:Wadjet anti-phage system protein JetA family protein ['Bituminaria bituminosa' little leaf phytoplasma]MDV3148593.1 DUF5716 family protein [Pigeon pea little leaf phytoplasma]MDO7983581.1 DUF5716 family protein ['Bituminaria bituminosa' little leaf phytoplasma]MDO8023719.1 DUF5716 family protein ['Bituminaria bituminosa' little leaf phytoplasma]MDO8030551.1 DUF5716 family protein ['Bituminaria bituminosa' little leaf phytoplasma]MDV3154183.1 DUF5716 family protein [Pigeon pea little leaf ph
MSHNLFDILPLNFFNLLSSSNKEIYLDCLLLLADLANDEFDGYINKNLAISVLEKYFSDKNNFFSDDEIDSQILTDAKQKASKIIYLFKKYGWIGEERIGYNNDCLSFFDYSLEMIHFFKKTVNQVKPESIGNIYSIYSLLKSLLIEKNYANFYEALIKTQNILWKLKILKSNIYRFYYNLLNSKNYINTQILLSQLLINYKKNFFDSSYYWLKTSDNFFKYRRYINLFLNQLEDYHIYLKYLSEQLCVINQKNSEENVELIKEQIKQMKVNLKIADRLIEIIDIKNEQYLQIICQRILLFDNKKDNLVNLLLRGIRLINDYVFEYNYLFNLSYIHNLDQFSFYKPRRHKQNLVISKLNLISEKSKNLLISKKNYLLNKDSFYTKDNILKFVKNLKFNQNCYLASDINLEKPQDLSRLMLILLYSSKLINFYSIKSLYRRIIVNDISFSNFLIIKK